LFWLSGVLKMRLNLNTILLRNLCLFGIVIAAPELAFAGGSKSGGMYNTTQNHSAQHAPVHSPARNPVKSSPVTLHPSTMPAAAYNVVAAHKAVAPVAMKVPIAQNRMYHNNGAGSYGANNYSSSYYPLPSYAYSSAAPYYRNDPVAVPVPYPVISYSTQEPRGYYAAPYAAPKIITIETVGKKHYKHHARYKHHHRHHVEHKSSRASYGGTRIVTRYNTDFEPNMVRVRVRKD
jgi:hypothetical protein